MQIKYVKNKIYKIIFILLIVIAILLGIYIAALPFTKIDNEIIIALLVIVIIAIPVIYNEETNNRVMTLNEDGFVDKYGKFQFSKMKSVFCSSNQIQIYYDTGNLITDYNQDLIDKLKEQNIEFNDKKKSLKKINYLILLIMFFIVGYLFYNLFTILFGFYYVKNYDYVIIDGINLVLRILKVITGIVLLIFYRNVKKNKTIIIVLLTFMAILMISSNFIKIDHYNNVNGDYVCVLKNNRLSIYKNLIKEYGEFTDRISHVNKFKVVTLTDSDDIIVYQKDKETFLRPVYRDKLKETNINEIINQYDGFGFANLEYLLIFDKGTVSVSNLEGNYDYKTMFVNQHLLEVYQNNKVIGYIVLNDKIDDEYFDYEKMNSIEFICLNDNQLKYNHLEIVESSEAENNYDSSTTSDDSDIIEDEVSPETDLSPEVEMSCKEAVDQMNQIIASGIENFESTPEFVKIEAVSDDYNQIILEVAKQFTIINNDNNTQIDTQILNISITSGDINEFGASVFDRQDITNQEKITNDYKYRVKKAGNYYLAARLSENSNVDEGLELLDNPITTDTSWTTDFMYRIKGKEYLGNSW